MVVQNIQRFLNTSNLRCFSSHQVSWVFVIPKLGHWPGYSLCPEHPEFTVLPASSWEEPDGQMVYLGRLLKFIEIGSTETLWKIGPFVVRYSNLFYETNQTGAWFYLQMTHLWDPVLSGKFRDDPPDANGHSSWHLRTDLWLFDPVKLTSSDVEISWKCHKSRVPFGMICKSITSKEFLVIHWFARG